MKRILRSYQLRFVTLILTLAMSSLVIGAGHRWSGDDGDGGSDGTTQSTPAPTQAPKGKGGRG